MCDSDCCSTLSLMTTNISAPTEIVCFSKSCILFRKFLCGSLPQCISRPTTNFWLTGRAKQALANQRGPWQHQRPLGQAPLATAEKDADHIVPVSQSELPLLCDSIWSAHGNSNPSSSNTTNWLWKWSPWPLRSLCQRLPLYGWLAVTWLSNTKDHHQSCNPARSGHSSAGIHQEFMWLSLQIPETISHTYCYNPYFGVYSAVQCCWH
jgi:hypothetical protein